MKKRYIKTIAVVLCLIMGIGLVIPIGEVNAQTINEDLKQVIICETEDKVIVALVDEEKFAAYTNAIVDEEFKNSEIAKANLQRKLPEGEIMSQKYLDEEAIRKTVDRNAGAGTYASLISNPINDTLIATLIKKAGCSNVWSFAATAIAWAVGDLMNRQQDWWIESLVQILEHNISYVRVTHIRNTTSDYPAAYLIIERI